MASIQEKVAVLKESLAPLDCKIQKNAKSFLEIADELEEERSRRRRESGDFLRRAWLSELEEVEQISSVKLAEIEARKVEREVEDLLGEVEEEEGGLEVERKERAKILNLMNGARTTKACGVLESPVELGGRNEESSCRVSSLKTLEGSNRIDFSHLKVKAFSPRSEAFSLPKCPPPSIDISPVAKDNEKSVERKTDEVGNEIKFRKELFRSQEMRTRKVINECFGLPEKDDDVRMQEKLEIGLGSSNVEKVNRFTSPPEEREDYLPTSFVLAPPLNKKNVFLRKHEKIKAEEAAELAAEGPRRGWGVDAPPSTYETILRARRVVKKIDAKMERYGGVEGGRGQVESLFLPPKLGLGTKEPNLFEKHYYGFLKDEEGERRRDEEALILEYGERSRKKEKEIIEHLRRKAFEEELLRKEHELKKLDFKYQIHCRKVEARKEIKSYIRGNTRKGGEEESISKSNGNNLAMFCSSGTYRRGPRVNLCAG